jgi:prefoldin beta subunit
MSQAAAQRLEEEVKLLRKMQDEAQQTMNTRAQLVAQMKENELVKQELDLIADDDEGARIYKLIGPVLVKQEKKEAASNVGKRIDFLQVPPPPAYWQASRFFNYINIVFQIVG